MYERKTLGLAEAEVAIRAVIEEASKTTPPVGVAVVDDSNVLVMFAKMDGAINATEVMAPKKAYTSANTGRNTRDFMQKTNQVGLDISDFDTKYTRVPGGNLIVEPGGAIVGAVGVSGRTIDEDERLSLIGKKAVEDYLQRSK